MWGLETCAFVHRFLCHPFSASHVLWEGVDGWSGLSLSPISRFSKILSFFKVLSNHREGKDWGWGRRGLCKCF